MRGKTSPLRSFAIARLNRISSRPFVGGYIAPEKMIFYSSRESMLMIPLRYNARSPRPIFRKQPGSAVFFRGKFIPPGATPHYGKSALQNLITKVIRCIVEVLINKGVTTRDRSYQHLGTTHALAVADGLDQPNQNS
jgi:hypothetical protein